MASWRRTREGGQGSGDPRPRVQGLHVRLQAGVGTTHGASSPAALGGPRSDSLEIASAGGGDLPSPCAAAFFPFPPP